MTPPEPWEPGGEPQWIVDERRRNMASWNSMISMALVRPLMPFVMGLPLLLGLGLEQLGWISDHRTTGTVGVLGIPLVGLIMLFGGIRQRRRSERATFGAELGNTLIGLSLIILLLGALIAAVWFQGGGH